jgi:cytochrome c-type biogenesis protein CcmH/NrfG
LFIMTATIDPNTSFQMDKSSAIMNPINEEVDLESIIGSHTGAEEHFSNSADKVPEIARKETRWVNYSKVLVVVVILLMASVIGVVTYQFVSSQEAKDYQQQVRAIRSLAYS